MKLYGIKAAYVAMYLLFGLSALPACSRNAVEDRLRMEWESLPADLQAVKARAEGHPAFKDWAAVNAATSTFKHDPMRYREMIASLKPYAQQYGFAGGLAAAEKALKSIAKCDNNQWIDSDEEREECKERVWKAEIHRIHQIRESVLSDVFETALFDGISSIIASKEMLRKFAEAHGMDIRQSDDKWNSIEYAARFRRRRGGESEVVPPLVGMKHKRGIITATWFVLDPAEFDSMAFLDLPDRSTKYKAMHVYFAERLRNALPAWMEDFLEFSGVTDPNSVGKKIRDLGDLSLEAFIDLNQFPDSPSTWHHDFGAGDRRISVDTDYERITISIDLQAVREAREQLKQLMSHVKSSVET